MSIQTSTKDRVFLLDNIKGLLIFLVVFGHSLELYKHLHISVHTLYMFIYLFHMPAFVFISGYFSKDLDKCRETAFKNFLLPFIAFNTIWNLMAALGTQDLESFSFTTPGWALWYLLSMFFWRIFLKDLVKVRFIIPLSFFIGLGAGIFGEFNSMLSLSRTLVFFPFFLLGYRTSEERLFQLKKPTRLYSCVIILLAVGFAYLVSYYNILPVEFLYGSDSFIAHTVPIWLGLLGRILLYIIGFSFIFALPNIFTSQSTFFSKIGKNTLSIYLIHTYLIGIIFVINVFIPFLWGKIVICVVGSVLITSFLSRNCVNQQIEKTINYVITLIIRP